MQGYQWSQSYREAVCEDQRTVRMVRINIAVNECLRCLFDIGSNTERHAEHKEILCALNDLRVLIHLHRKYAQFALIQT